jgi:transcriptional regulator with XRE-family HTH domain
MTLTELAEASSVSVGLLSRLENGVGNPAFASLGAIARGLGVDVYLFFEPSANGEKVLTSADRIRLRVPRTNVELELLVPGFHSRIVGMLVTLPPGFQPAEHRSAKPGQQFEVALDGSVEYRIEREVHQLESGDLILFDASRPHSRRNICAHAVGGGRVEVAANAAPRATVAREGQCPETA